MLCEISKMYVTLLPMILTAIINALFCKSSILNVLKVPIDRGKVLKDGRRLFGSNKTWKGFIGTIVICSVLNIVWGGISSLNQTLENMNYMYVYYQNTWIYNMLTGFLFGAAYAVLELPNSYIKRRLNITSGNQGKGGIGTLFKIYDQVDSLIGVMLVVAIFGRLSFKIYVLYVIVGGVTHVAVNFILFELKLRKTIL